VFDDEIAQNNRLSRIYVGLQLLRLA